MRRNKKGLFVGALGIAVLGGASALAWSAGAFESGVSLSPGTNEAGKNYSTSIDDAATVVLADGSAVLDNPTIFSGGANGIGVALQGSAVLTLNRAFITATGANNVGFLFDNGAQILTVNNSTLGANKVAYAQNNSFATLNLVGNDKINGEISTDASSTLSVVMSGGNTFRGSLNGNVSLALSADSVLYLTGDSFITSLSDDLVDYSNIYLCGYTLTSSEGLIAGNEADCGSLVGGFGAPTHPTNPSDPDPEPEPEPTPTPDPDPEPTPTPTPTPTPDPDPEPAPTTPPDSSSEPATLDPVYNTGKGYYNPNTADNINGYLIVLAVAAIGAAISGAMVFKSVRSKKKK